jgi:hypothetical protein
MLLRCVSGSGEKNKVILSKLLTSKILIVGVFAEAQVGGCAV